MRRMLTAQSQSATRHTPHGNTRRDSHEKTYRLDRPLPWALGPNLARRCRPNASGSSPS